MEDAGPDYTLGNVCQKLPVATCAVRQGCCEQSGVGFSQEECVKRETDACKALVAEVSSGDRTFNPDKIPACLGAVEPLLKACKFSGEQFVSYLKMVNVCNAIFDSKNGPGHSCKLDIECTTSTDPNGYSGCSEANGGCFQSTFGKVGDNCNQKVCGEGLACVYPAFSGTGTCQTKTAEGSFCSGSVQCGYGYYCPPVIGPETCKPAQAGGASCNSPLHCLSLECAGGQCTQQALYVTPDACGK